MGQIVKRKKKGRPSKADLARRASEGEPPGAAAPERDVRRSLRRRNVRYIFDFDDFDDLDEEEEEEVDDERRRQKKLKLLLKLQGKEGGAESVPSRTQRVDHAPPASPSSSDSEEKPPKKRKIDGGGGGDTIDADADENDVKNGEIRGTKSGSKGADSVPGTPSDPPLGLPLPDKKTLELILDKLQKKDTYGVYAEPVDPEELPDYHEVIEHPMDFATVRKKLGNGSYSTLEQFEGDVILICTNAMQYNAPDTIYHKQARSIQELAKKKFQRLRVDAEPYDKELKTDQKTRSTSYGKKQIKKPMSRVTQEPVGSDFSSGAALATAAEFQSASNATTHIGGLERLTNVDAPVEGSMSQIDNNLDKPEDLQARGLLSRFGRKPFLHDENRRATYNNSDQPVVGSESIFTTFEGEIKQLVTVGLHSDHSYARSLARFSATLGPVAWKVASRRIEQALPPGFKFGRGWVGDYEPLPTPILVLENCSQKEPAFLTKSSDASDVRKDDKSTKAPGPVQERTSFPALEGNSSLSDAAVTKSTVTATGSNLVPAREQSVRRTILEGKQPFFGSGGSKPTMAGSTNYQQQSPRSTNYQQQSPRSRNNGPEKKVVKQVELNHLPTSTNQNMNNLVAEKQIPNGLDVPASRSMETVSRNRNIVQSSSFKHPENKGIVAGGLPNGKVTNNNLDRNRMAVSSSDTNQLAAPAIYFPHGQEQGLSDPVHLMRMMAENAQKQQKSSNNSPVGSPSVIPTSGPSSRRDDSNNAAAAAARAWMSIGAGGSKVTSENMSAHTNHISADSLYNPARDLQPQASRFRGDFPPGMHFQPAKNSFPLQPFGAPPVRMGFQNRPVLFPQLVTADLSRFPVQPPWQGPSPKRHPKEKQESHPPDLNIGFQPSGSPVRQSSGVLVDSQQPDLALQL